MFRRWMSLVLIAVLVFSLFGCSNAPAETQPQTESTVPTTLPPVTEPSAEELYADARKAIDEAQNLQLSVTMSRKRSVGGETYTESATQSISLQGIGCENLQVMLEDTTTADEYVFSSKEYFTGGTVWTMFENLPFTAEVDTESYLSRLAPAILVDASLYATVTAEPIATGTKITFSDPTAGEAWLIPEDAELVTASGAAILDENGALSRTDYSVTYIYGSTEIQQSWSTAVTIPETMNLSNTLPVSDGEYVKLDYIDAPWLMTRAIYDIMQTSKLSCTTIDTMISYAGGVIFSQQEYVDIYGTGADTMYNYKADISLQDYSGILDEYKYEENLQAKMVKYSENEAPEATKLVSDAQVESLRSHYIEQMLTYPWTPGNLAGASITDLGSVYLLEFTGNKALGEDYEAGAVSTFWGDENFLMDLAEDYRTETLTAYLSIDKYTELPVSFGYSYEGIHTLDGQEYVLSDQWDQTFFLGSNTAYEAITEEPTPDVEPEEKATPLFYHVTGENGQEMWLIGTIHVGDDRTGYLPQEIYDALAASDALAVEFDGEAFDEALENDEELLSQVQNAYFYEDGSMTKDHLDEEVYEDAVKFLKATGNYYMNAEYLKPYLWSQSIDNFMLRQGYGLVSEKGVDNRLLKLAREMEMEILDVESGLFQIQMLCGYSEDLQQLLLEESLYTDSAAYCDSVEDLYEKWLAGDEAVLREELSSQVDTSELTEEELAEYEEQKPLLDEYNKAMSYDRNEGMLDVAIDYLESGRTIFYAVGLAHLLDDVNGLVDALREAGYTVELVVYQ